MSARLPTGLAVSALLRRVNDAGGLAVVRAKGDPQAGAVLVTVTDRNGPTRCLERGIGPSGEIALIDTTPRDSDPAAIDDYCRRRRARDPDLWLIDLNIPSAERFVAETILDR